MTNLDARSAPLPATEQEDAAPELKLAERPGLSLGQRMLNLVAVVLPLLGLIAAIVLLWGVAFNWVYLALLVGMYIVTALGVTIGFHRLFTHKSFKAPRPVTAVLAIMGSMAVEGAVMRWVATHRRHHQHSDGEEDPHSPHTHGHGLVSTARGLWHAHIGWIFKTYSFVPSKVGASAADDEIERYAVDLRKDPLIRRMDRLFPLWVVLGLAIPAVLGGLLTMSWMGVLLGFIWGGLVRILLVHHVTWSINSVCHIWGTKPFRSHDESRNNAVFGVLAMGEGWHNNHHAFPTSARHGLRWWEFDLSYLIIRGMGLVGLASDIKQPSAERIAEKRRDAGPRSTA